VNNSFLKGNENGLEDEILFGTKAGPAEEEVLARRRIKHNLFKSNLKKVEKACRITGITDHRYLIASHIKPWSESVGDEKTDGYNGLLLAPHIDHLFNYGYISFDDLGNLLASELVPESLFISWGIPRHCNVGKFTSQQKKYLEHHRKKYVDRKLR
jgi:hypothetical protein